MTFAPSNPKTDEREVLRDLLEVESGLLVERPGQVILADRGYRSGELETFLAERGVSSIRPAMKGEPAGPDARFLRLLRQIIESVNGSLNGQLDLEHHGGRTPAGVFTRVGQRLLTVAAVIWHNDRIGARPHRSLLAYDH